ncbi:CPBP family intramembrane metalloprotease [Halorussus sp. MSC15.2]|nr:CPBP family intramembrane metalloprotease [Halorussus sp. MSC15.2]
MFEDPEAADERPATDEAESRVPATGAARIERHADTGKGRHERRILDDDESNPWSDETGRRTEESPWGENRAETDARRARDPTTEPSVPEQQAGGAEEDLNFSTGALLTNVAFSQGLLGAAIVAAAWLADVPLAALGVRLGDPWSVGLPAVGVGAAVGVALYAANELSTTLADAAGIEYSEGLREALAPDTLGGWAVLLVVVLPVIAGFEELLFRAALVGAFATGFGLSPWLLAAFSTVAFAVGHGAQGPGGVAVTGLLGFALAAAFVLTGSLLVVVVAHYLVNALEFVVHEGLGVEWT